MSRKLIPWRRASIFARQLAVGFGANRRLRALQRGRSQPRTPLYLELLEDRCLLTGTLPAGIYIEDFTDDLDPTRGGFDRTGAFQHCFETFTTHCITDPLNTVGENYVVNRWVDPLQDDLQLFYGLDRITFPNLMPDVHVAFAVVDVTWLGSRVEFVGLTRTLVVNVTAEIGQIASASAGEGHIFEDGTALGPIQQIILPGPAAIYGEVRILATPSLGPRALDDFVHTSPNKRATFDVLENDWDAEGLPLRIDGFQQPANGEVRRQSVTPPEGGPLRDGLEYIPAVDYHGPDSFTYTVANTAGQKITATVHVSVNRPPIAESVRILLDHGTPGPINGVLSISDPDGDPLSGFEIISPPQHGIVTLDETGFFSYQPTPVDIYDHATGRTIRNVSTVRGSDEFTYRVHDGLDATDGVVNIDALNSLNVRVADDNFMVEATPAGMLPRFIFWSAPGVLHNDFGQIIRVEGEEFFRKPGIDEDGDPLTVELTRGADNGGLVLNADGSFFYTPEPGYQGLDGFNYRVTDGFLFSDEIQVTLLVDDNIAPNIAGPPPTAVDDEYALFDFLPQSEFRIHRLDEVNDHLSPITNDLNTPDLFSPDGRFSLLIVRGGEEMDSFALSHVVGFSPTFFLYPIFWGEGVHTFTYAYIDKGTNLLSNFAKITVNLRTSDSDGDGVTDGEELGGVFGTSFIDSRQVRLPILMGWPVVQPELFSESSFSQVEVLANPHPSDSPAGVIFPIGFITFELNLAPGQLATSATLTLPPGMTMSAYYKYAPEPDNLSTLEDETEPHWWEFTWDDASQTGAKFSINDEGRQVITLHFVDGGRGDEDGEINGVIRDPGGAAFSLNSPPTASINGPKDAVRGQPLAFAFSASDPDPADQAGTFRYEIDWNGDGTVDETREAGNVLNLTHVYGATGDVHASAKVRTPDGSVSATVTHDVSITDVAILDGRLFAGGTTGNDTIEFTLQKKNQIWVRIGKTKYGPFAAAAVSALVAYGQEGKDTIVVSSSLKKPAELDGGPGNDRLIGGSVNSILRGGDGDDSLRGGKQNDILLGGAGNDMLKGDSGRDLMIGGHGRDKLFGGSHDDCLIGGTTSHDSNPLALQALLAEWTSSRRYATRVSNLTIGSSTSQRANGNYFLKRGDTVLDDAAIDVLIGNGGTNWFLES